MKNKCLSDGNTERTKEINKIGEDLTRFFLKSCVFLLACVFENFIKVSVNEFGVNPVYSVSLPCYNWQCDLKYTDIKLQTIQDKDMIPLLENNLRGGTSSVLGDRYAKSDDNKKDFLYFS